MASQLDNDDEITGINVTPLVDIVLVLLVIFMMTASFIVAPAIRVDLPKAQSGEQTPQSTLSLVLTKEGVLYLNNQLCQPDDVRRYIRNQHAEGKELQAVIAADANVIHGKVIGLIDLIKTEGVTNFAINTESDFTGAPAPNGASGAK